MLCRRSDILWSLDAADADDVGVNVREALAKAPRPVLHLLRSCELAKVDAQQREEVYEHNEASAEGIKVSGVSKDDTNFGVFSTHNMQVGWVGSLCVMKHLCKIS